MASMLCLPQILLPALVPDLVADLPILSSTALNKNRRTIKHSIVRCQSEDTQIIMAAFSILFTPVAKLCNYETSKLQRLSSFTPNDLRLKLGFGLFPGLGNYESLQIRWRPEPA